MELLTAPKVKATARKLVVRLVALGRYTKRAILAITDFFLLSLALWLAISIRLGEPYSAPNWQLTLLFCAAPVVGVATFSWVGLYKLVTRYIAGSGALIIPIAVILSTLIWALLVFLSGVQTANVDLSVQGVQVVPRSVVILYPIFGILLVWGARLLAGRLLKSAGIELPVPRGRATNVLIFGAGTTGVQLAEALRYAASAVPVAFVDTSSTLWGQYIAGLKVYRPERMAGLVERHDVREVLLAIPNANRQERRAALRSLEALPVAVRTLPAIEELAAGRVTVNDLRRVAAEDLLGRDPVPPRAALMSRNIRNKSVLVTGAGGSIGSELVRQILRNSPRRLVLFDAGEESLYQIELEVKELLRALSEHASADQAPQPQIATVLGSILDGALVRQTIEGNIIDTIYHAAAYKHVPIVEHNAIAGLRNNTFGTAILAEVAEQAGVERFVLVSTDKAVRPSSIMGASKRLAEMILQARSSDGPGRTVFTMVRFGNVLDSSGSVVRRFRQQIEAGGPVTVTHQNAVRFFMSIQEAAALVIQAGAMATGGEVFVLDMGEPLKIDELAKSMIRLMGLEVRDAQCPDGDVAIEYIGLRHGEKLHEELLLGDNTTPTEHPRILRSSEPFLPSAELAQVLETLATAMADVGSIQDIHAVLMNSVEGYQPERRHLPPLKKPNGETQPNGAAGSIANK